MCENRMKLCGGYTCTLEVQDETRWPRINQVWPMLKPFLDNDIDD